MEAIYERCCGLDVHQATVVACIIVPGPHGRPHKEIRTFGTMTPDVLRLAEWLTQHGVTHVALESTGVYVRRIAARAIPAAGRTGSEGNPWVND